MTPDRIAEIISKCHETIEIGWEDEAARRINEEFREVWRKSAIELLKNHKCIKCSLSQPKEERQ